MFLICLFWFSSKIAWRCMQETAQNTQWTKTLVNTKWTLEATMKKSIKRIRKCSKSNRCCVCRLRKNYGINERHRHYHCAVSNVDTFYYYYVWQRILYSKTMYWRKWEKKLRRNEALGLISAASWLLLSKLHNKTASNAKIRYKKSTNISRHKFSTCIGDAKLAKWMREKKKIDGDNR